MMEESRFYICERCGNMVGMIHDAGVPLMCCGQKMTHLEGNATAAKEKHLPVVTCQSNAVTVSVGSIAHPMTEEHHIAWVYLQTDRGGQRKDIAPGETPEVSFLLTEETPLAVYAYCNQHGLWKTEL